MVSAFPELLGGPAGRGAFDDIEVQKAAARVRQDDENVEYPKGEGGNGEEVDRNHAAEVIAKEGLPVLGRRATSAMGHVFRDGSLSEGDPELEQLAVNPGSAPQRIGATHLADQIDGVRGDRRSADSARPASPPPEEAETCSLPSDDGVRLEDPERPFPSIPSVGEPDPEGAVRGPQARSVGAAAQDEQLVAQGQVFQEQVPTRFQRRGGEAEDQNEPTNHVAEDSRKRLRNPAFSDRMRFLPRTRGGSRVVKVFEDVG